MPTEKCKGLYGGDRVVSWPDKKKKKKTTPEEEIFIKVRESLEEYQDLSLSSETDRLVLTHILTKLFKRSFD